MKSIFAKYFQGLISSPSESEANSILENLLKERLVSGGTIIKGRSMYSWKNGIEKEDYWNITVFTVAKNRRKIIEIVKKISVEEIPLVIFTKINSSNEVFNWIKNNTN